MKAQQAQVMMRLAVLFALAFLVLRPIAVELLDVPPDPARLHDVSTGTDSENCRFVSDCSPSPVTAAPFVLDGASLLAVLSGATLLLLLAVAFTYRGGDLREPDPPPIFAAA